MLQRSICRSNYELLRVGRVRRPHASAACVGRMRRPHASAATTLKNENLKECRAPWVRRNIEREPRELASAWTGRARGNITRQDQMTRYRRERGAITSKVQGTSTLYEYIVLWHDSECNQNIIDVNKSANFKIF